VVVPSDVYFTITLTTCCAFIMQGYKGT